MLTCSVTFRDRGSDGSCLPVRFAVRTRVLRLKFCYCGVVCEAHGLIDYLGNLLCIGCIDG